MSSLVFVYALWHTVFVKQDVHNIIQRLTISVFFDILELDEDEDFSRMSTDPVLAYDDYRRKEKRLKLIFKTSRPDLNIGDPVTLNFEQESGAK